MPNGLAMAGGKSVNAVLQRKPQTRYYWVYEGSLPFSNSKKLGKILEEQDMISLRTLVKHAGTDKRNA